MSEEWPSEVEITAIGDSERSFLNLQTGKIRTEPMVLERDEDYDPLQGL